MKLDTGAEINVIPEEMLKKLGISKLNESNITIKSFGGYKTKSKESILLNLQNENNNITQIFKVVEYSGLLLMSYEACVQLRYKMPEICQIQRSKDRFIEKYKNVFEGIGKFLYPQIIKLSKNAVPKSSPPRRVAMTIYNKLKENLVRLGLIENCDVLCEWQSNLMIVEKPDGTLRVCLDLKEINKLVIREIYQIPTLEGIRPTLANKNFILC